MAPFWFQTHRNLLDKVLRCAPERKGSFSFQKPAQLPCQGEKRAAQLRSPSLGKNISIRPDLAAQSKQSIRMICKGRSREDAVQHPIICKKHH